METPIQDPGTDNQQAPTAKINPERLEELLREKRAAQNMQAAVLAGLAAALVGAAAWAVVTVATQYQIGWMAVGVGFLVGFAVRRAGKGVEPKFGYVGAGLALLGCLAGNLFSTVGFAAAETHVGFFTLLGKLDPSTIVELLKATFSPIDLLFYGIAVYEGYRFSFQTLTKEEAASLST